MRSVNRQRLSSALYRKCADSQIFFGKQRYVNVCCRLQGNRRGAFVGTGATEQLLTVGNGAHIDVACKTRHVKVAFLVGKGHKGFVCACKRNLCAGHRRVAVYATTAYRAVGFTVGHVDCRVRPHLACNHGKPVIFTAEVYGYLAGQVGQDVFAVFVGCCFGKFATYLYALDRVTVYRHPSVYRKSVSKIARCKQTQTNERTAKQCHNR